MKRLIDFGAMFFLMLFTGVFFGTWLPVVRYVSDLPAAEFIRFMQILINSTAVPMQVIMPIGFVLAAVSVWNSKSRNSRRFYIAIISVVILFIIIAMSLTLLLPINFRLIHLTPDTIPDDWERLRASWKLIHSIRTFLAMIAFAGFSWYIAGRRVVNQGLSYNQNSTPKSSSF